MNTEPFIDHFNRCASRCYPAGKRNRARMRQAAAGLHDVTCTAQLTHELEFLLGDTSAAGYNRDMPQETADRQRALDEDFEQDLQQNGPEALDELLTSVLAQHKKDEP